MWEAFENKVREAQNETIPNKEINPTKRKWRVPLDRSHP
jgi:hypothetical protein